MAQGIVAQSRVLGGSIGIAASTAILGQTEHNDLVVTGLLSDSQLATLQTAAKSLTPTQLAAVSKAYSDSFREIMIVCVVIAGLGVLASLMTWDSHPPNLTEMMEERHRRAADEDKETV